MLAAQRRAARRRQVLTLVALVAGVVLIGFLVSRGGGDDDEVATTDTTTADGGDPFAAADYQPGAAECPPEDGSAEPKKQFDGPPPKCIDLDKDYQAVIETDLGEITIDLLEDRAPLTVNNFVFLARWNAYRDVPFHRVVKEFVIQTGDVELGDGTGGPGYQFKDELPKPEDYEEGSVAMANSGANTNGSQFFILVSDDAAQTLVNAVGGSANYSLFGKVLEGMDVVKAIEADGSEMSQGTPTTVHKVVDVRIVEAEAQTEED